MAQAAHVTEVLWALQVAAGAAASLVGAGAVLGAGLVIALEARFGWRLVERWRAAAAVWRKAREMGKPAAARPQ